MNIPASVHSILLDDEQTSFLLKQSSKAKYLRLQINSAGQLEVVLPRGIQLKEAEAFIKKKSDWIKKHLSRKRTEDDFLFLGEQIKIREYFHLFQKKHKITFKDNLLEIISPETSTIELKHLYNVWLRHTAKNYIPQRTIDIARQYNFTVKKITIRGQKTRWGSCNLKGSLSFNFRLMRFRKEVIDYVIIHELCHLRHMNHSKAFWQLVEKYSPDYRNLRRELKGRIPA